MASSDQKRAASTSITDAWYQGAIWLYIFAPLSLLYLVLIYLRTLFFKLGFLSSYRSSLPVVVVGNITVGGTGKSPLVAYLVRSLQAKGYRPGIISRGYGAEISKDESREVLPSSVASEVGDEPLMLKQALGCPIFVSPNRMLSIQALENQGCDIVICDDGLQHYALQRDIEISVFDGARGVGNRFLLPMGPMRELSGRLDRVDFKVINGASKIPGLEKLDDTIRMDLLPARLLPLTDEPDLVEKAPAKDLSEYAGKTVNAVAAIGNPERFFELLERNGMIVNRYAFEDHHSYCTEDFEFADALPLIMTEKDAVKCRSLGLKNAWYLPVEAVLEKNLAELIIEKI
jgi:tetraacyldisaccharide 4'-kinase